jgi:hypothetical protein
VCVPGIARNCSIENQGESWEAWWGPGTVDAYAAPTYEVELTYPKSSKVEFKGISVGFKGVSVSLGWTAATNLNVKSNLPISATAQQWRSDFVPVVVLQKRKVTRHVMIRVPDTRGRDKYDGYDMSFLYHYVGGETHDVYTQYAEGTVCAKCTNPKSDK